MFKYIFMFNFGQKNIEDLKSLSLEVDTFFFFFLRKSWYFYSLALPIKFNLIFFWEKNLII